jgi:hypothetical protein
MSESGSKAAVWTRAGHVRYAPDNGRGSTRPAWQRRATFCLTHPQQEPWDRGVDHHRLAECDLMFVGNE